MGVRSHQITLTLALLVLAGSLCSAPVAAQSTAAPESLDQALERLATTAEVSLVYDADLVRGYDVSCAIEGSEPEPTLRCLLAGTDLDFVQTSGGTYVIKPDVRRPPQRGTVQGVVRDAETNGPLPQAHVRLADAEAGAVTDKRGHFRFADLVTGSHTLVVSHLGYETTRVEIRVRPDNPARTTVPLSPTPIATAPVVVDAPSAEALPPSRSHATLSPRQLDQPAAAGTPSVAHAAGTLMGISTQAPYADLHVQGGASSAHEVRLDGVPVRNPATAGRLLGALSPLALDGLTARTAGFGVLQGDVLSGVIELEHDLDRPDVRYGAVRLDPVALNGRAEGRIDLGETTATVMAAGRTSVWDLHRSRTLSRLINTWSVLDPVLTAAQITADTLQGSLDNRRARPRSRFYDLHGAARFALAPTHHLSVSAYHGRSTLGTDLVVNTDGIDGSPPSDSDEGPTPNVPSSVVTVPASDRYQWANTVAQARYETQLTDRATGRLQASVNRYRATSTYEVGTLRPLFTASSGSLSQYAQSAAGGSWTSNTVVDFGVDGTLDLSFSEGRQLTLSGGMSSMGTEVRLANAFTGVVRHDARAPRVTAAGEGTLPLGPFTTIDAGLRLTALPDRGAVFAEPRGAIRHHRPHTALGDVAVRVGGGLYRQYTTQFELSRDGATSVVPTAQVWMPVPQGLTPPRTYHLATDLTWRPGSAWSVGLEGYAKWQPHLLAVDYPALQSQPPLDPVGPSEVLSESRGRTYGGGVEVSYEGDRATGTLRYAYTRARRTFPGRFDGRAVPAPWADPHRLTLEGRLPLGNVFALDLRGTGIWGRSWGYRRSYYAYLQPDEADASLPDLSQPADHVLPPLYRMDAALVATHSWGNVEVTGRVGLINVLGRANVADWGLRPSGANTVTRRPRTLPGRRSVVSLQLQY